MLANPDIARKARGVLSRVAKNYQDRGVGRCQVIDRDDDIHLLCYPTKGPILHIEALPASSSRDQMRIYARFFNPDRTDSMDGLKLIDHWTGRDDVYSSPEQLREARVPYHIGKLKKLIGEAEPLFG